MGPRGTRLIPGPTCHPTPSSINLCCEDVLVCVVASFGPKIASETASEHY